MRLLLVKMEKLRISILLSFCISLLSLSLSASDTCNIRINEVALQPDGGGPAQETREWIELYNPSCTDSVDLTGWYIRTDVMNDINSSMGYFGDDMIVTWATRNPGTSPYDLNPGFLDTNNIVIPPKGFAVIIDPTWNDTLDFMIDIPDSAIILTVATYLNLGSDGNNSSPKPNTLPNPGPGNGLLYNDEDYVLLYDGDPSLSGSKQIDSIGWFDNSPNMPGFSIQRDNDCITRWHYLAIDSIGGHALDIDSSLAAPFTIGAQNHPINAPFSSIFNSQDSACVGDTLDFGFEGSFLCCSSSYLWGFDDPGSGSSNIDTVQNTSHVFNSSGTYAVSLTLSDGCTNVVINKSVAIIAPVVELGNDTSLCSPGSLTLDAGNSGASYLWSTGETTQTINVTSSDTFYVTVNFSFGCQASDTIEVTVINIAADAGNDTTICLGDSHIIGGSPTGPSGATFSWNNVTSLDNSIVSNPLATPNETTSYTVSVTNGNCSTEDSITITVLDYNADAGLDTAMCQGNSVLIGGSPTGPTGASFTWSPAIGLDNALTANPVATPLITTTYIVTVNTNTICGSFFDSVSVSVNPLPVVTAGNDITIFAGSSVELLGSGGPSYMWSPSTGLSCTSCQNPVASPDLTTTYFLTVIDANGCTSTDTSVVFVEPLVNVVFVPNVFSPNGDGLNDVLDLQGNLFESIYFAIFDRWGEKVFETTDIDNDWDGTFNGEVLNSATFAYYLELVYLDGEEYTENGKIALIR